MRSPSRIGFETSPSLLARAQANQAGAWERLVELYAPLVYHWCRRAGLEAEDTADVFQEVFRAVAGHLAEFHRDRPGDSFRGWLRVIARNKIRDHFRQTRDEPLATGGTDAQQRLQAVAEPELWEDDPSEVDVVRRQMHRALELIKDEFEERTWQAFWKVQMEDRSTDEVGMELGMTPAAVRKAKFRVLRRLRQEIGM
jgi:RNA polymerase sigma-70 factor (ECF subfamily)